MNGRRTRMAAALVVTGLALVALMRAPPEPVRRSDSITDIVHLARRWNIRNLVTAIYLGPRAADTFLEVMVVTLAVVGLRCLEEHQ